MALVAAGWLVGTVVTFIRRRRMSERSTVDVGRAKSFHGHTWRILTVTVAASGAGAALVVIAAVLLMPGFVDVGFLDWMAWPLPARLALHLPLAVTMLAAVLAIRLVLGATLRWWTPRIRALEVTLAVALTTLATQLALWHRVPGDPDRVGPAVSVTEQPCARDRRAAAQKLFGSIRAHAEPRVMEVRAS